MLAARWATQVQTFANMRTQVDAEPRGYLRPAIARVMAESEHGGGFPVDAQVRIEAHERDGLGRLLRYSARPALALERLREIDPNIWSMRASSQGRRLVQVTMWL